MFVRFILAHSWLLLSGKHRSPKIRLETAGDRLRKALDGARSHAQAQFHLGIALLRESGSERPSDGGFVPPSRRLVPPFPSAFPPLPSAPLRFPPLRFPPFPSAFPPLPSAPLRFPPLPSAPLRFASLRFPVCLPPLPLPRNTPSLHEAKRGQTKRSVVCGRVCVCAHSPRIQALFFVYMLPKTPPSLVLVESFQTY